jgi:hypothetical protein
MPRPSEGGPNQKVAPDRWLLPSLEFVVVIELLLSFLTVTKASRRPKQANLLLKTSCLMMDIQIVVNKSSAQESYSNM